MACSGSFSCGDCSPSFPSKLPSTFVNTLDVAEREDDDDAVLALVVAFEGIGGLVMKGSV